MDYQSIFPSILKSLTHRAQIQMKKPYYEPYLKATAPLVIGSESERRFPLQE